MQGKLELHFSQPNSMSIGSVIKYTTWKQFSNSLVFWGPFSELLHFLSEPLQLFFCSCKQALSLECVVKHSRVVILVFEIRETTHNSIFFQVLSQWSLIACFPCCWPLMSIITKETILSRVPPLRFLFNPVYFSCFVAEFCWGQGGKEINRQDNSTKPNLNKLEPFL